MALRMMPLKRQAASMAVRSMSTGEWRSTPPHPTPPHPHRFLAPALALAMSTTAGPPPCIYPPPLPVEASCSPPDRHGDHHARPTTGGWMSELPMGPPDALFGLIDS